MAEIDLRSDTVTRPTAAMRAVMAAAPVGDDVYGDDPSVCELEERVAEELGKQAAVFVPTGTMANQVAIRAHTAWGDEALADIDSHVASLEGGAAAALSGVSIRPVVGRYGIFEAAALRALLRTPDPGIPKSLNAPQTLLVLENTHNLGGGAVWPLETLARVAEVAHEAGLAVHMDGARLWNATTATSIAEEDFAAACDSVSVCFSKGLGAPMGSAIAGDVDFILRCRRFKQLFGGGFRQAGIMAAAAQFALDHHRDRLIEDHMKATRLAEGLAEINGIRIDPTRVQTNIVRFQMTSMPAKTMAALCRDLGLLIGTSGQDGMRAVTHGDVSMEDVDSALLIIKNKVATGA